MPYDMYFQDRIHNRNCMIICNSVTNMIQYQIDMASIIRHYLNRNMENFANMNKISN